MNSGLKNLLSRRWGPRLSTITGFGGGWNTPGSEGPVICRRPGPARTRLATEVDTGSRALADRKLGPRPFAAWQPLAMEAAMLGHRRLGATMEEYHRPCDEVGFNADEAHNIVKECIDGVLGGEDYNQNNINQWTASIVEQSLAHLVKLGKAYKYIVTCAVVQRSPYGFHTASSCFWDTTSDGTCTVRWENRTMNCIVNVFAIAIVL